MHHDIQLFAEYAVTPFVGVWIETSLRFTSLASKQVTPFVGVWIETDTSHDKHWPPRSHPSWVCGLKLLLAPLLSTWHRVTPFVGVWIETFAHLVLKQALRVTPFVGVWIETELSCNCSWCPPSHPSWVCGLKLSIPIWAKSSTGSHPSWVCGLKLSV